MAGKMDSEFLKKHHFWILLIPAVLFAFLAAIFIFSDVSAATEERDNENKKKKQEIDQVKAQARATLTKLDEQQKKLEGQQNEMWKQAWKEQSGFYAWPVGYEGKDKLKKALTEAKTLEFGSKKLDERQFDPFRQQFRDPGVYLNEYETLVKSLEPMQFNGTWDKVLTVTQWNPQFVPNYEDIWLALEDLWVQREFLALIHSVNQQAAAFKLLERKDQKGMPLEFAFESRIWRVRLRIERREGAAAPGGAGNYLVGELRNVSPRLQVYGIGNRLKLNLWFNDTTKDPILFPIEGTSVPGDPNPTVDDPKKWITIKTLKEHRLPDDVNVDQPDDTDATKRRLMIGKLEQFFDARTIPVKRIDQFAIGKLSDRHSNLNMFMSNFSKKEAGEGLPPEGGGGGSGAMGGGAGMMGSGMGMMGSGMGMMGAGPGPGGMGMMGGGFPKGDGGSGSGGQTLPSTSRYGLQRYRYVAVTDQVRRMPLGFTVVVDQAYANDISLAVANSKLRFQTTQTHWTRFHGTLQYSSGSTGGSDPIPGMGEGSVVGPGGPGSSGFGPGFGATPTNSRDDQFSANLLELSIYGIISMYEKFPEPAAKKP